jgi:hypothetical protein
LEAGKCNRIVYHSLSPEEETMMTTAPALVPWTDLSKYMVQYSMQLRGGEVWVSIHTATKSAMTCDLISILGT